MSQESNQIVKSFKANETIPAYAIVHLLTDSTIEVWDTVTSKVIGVSRDLTQPGAAAAVVIGGTARVLCNASISAGAIVGPTNTNTGSIVERGATNTSTSDFARILGIALENGSTNAVVEVLIQPQNYGLFH